MTRETSGFSSQQKGPVTPSSQAAQSLAKNSEKAESGKLEKSCSKERKEESVKPATSHKKEVVSFLAPSL